MREIDPATGQVRWEHEDLSPRWPGALSSAGSLTLAVGMEGYLTALDARTGKNLWHFGTGAPITASAITYAVDGKQYVAIASNGVPFLRTAELNPSAVEKDTQ